MFQWLRVRLLIAAMGLILPFSTIACAQPILDTTAQPEAATEATTESTTESSTSESTSEPNTETETATASVDGRPVGWREASHSNDVDPNYAVVFPDDKVNEITITISPDNWAAMQANMTDLLGEPGSRRQGGPGGGGFGGPRATASLDASNGMTGTATITATMPFTGAAPAGFQRPPGGGGPGFGGDMTIENPMWVTATIEFDGQTWTNVGVRYKGNSSLNGSWHNKSLKLPFKFDFDEFEQAYPEIDNQRFYGFKQLSLGNSFGDATYMRDAIAYDLYEDAGLVAAETAFYDVTLDYGEGPVNLGIYTVIEVIDDTVVNRAFGDDSGNLYEADGRAASLADGTYEQITESFQKENNEDTSDWSDIEALYTVLHAANRATDPAAWRAELEAIFDVDTFLEWLAISAELQHWDTYGGMTHNYYLYHDPATDQLTWISWDHNFVLGGTAGGMGGGMGGGMPRPEANAEANPGNNEQSPNAEIFGGPGGMGGNRGMNRNTSLDKADVDANWPLIRYLLDDPTYYARYIDYLAATNSEVFNADAMADQYAQWAEILAPYVDTPPATNATSETDFETAVQELIDRTYERAEAVQIFLAEQP